MRTIWKFEIPMEAWSGAPVEVEMPIGAQIRHVGVQEAAGQATICMWAEVSSDMTREPRRFSVMPTGGSMMDDVRYLGTVQIGWTVWHVLEHTGKPRATR